MKKKKLIAQQTEEALLVLDVALTFDHAFRLAYTSIKDTHKEATLLAGFCVALKAAQQEHFPDVLDVFKTVPKQFIKDFYTIRNAVDSAVIFANTPTKGRLQ